MKVKKIVKLLPAWETITIWGDDEDEYIWRGAVQDIPQRLMDRKLIEGEVGGYLDIRYNCSDCPDHVAIFVKGE